MQGSDWKGIMKQELKEEPGSQALAGGHDSLSGPWFHRSFIVDLQELQFLLILN